MPFCILLLAVSTSRTHGTPAHVRIQSGPAHTATLTCPQDPRRRATSHVVAQAAQVTLAVAASAAKFKLVACASATRLSTKFYVAHPAGWSVPRRTSPRLLLAPDLEHIGVAVASAGEPAPLPMPPPLWPLAWGGHRAGSTRWSGRRGERSGQPIGAATQAPSPASRANSKASGGGVTYAPPSAAAPCASAFRVAEEGSGAPGRGLAGSARRAPAEPKEGGERQDPVCAHQDFATLLKGPVCAPPRAESPRPAEGAGAVPCARPEPRDPAPPQREESPVSLAKETHGHGNTDARTKGHDLGRPRDQHPEPARNRKMAQRRRPECDARLSGCQPRPLPTHLKLGVKPFSGQAGAFCIPSHAIASGSLQDIVG